MSLRQEWYAAQLQRQQEFLERFQQVAAFLEEVRSHHQQLWQEQRQQRTAYVAASKNSVWGTTPASGNDSNTTT